MENSSSIALVEYIFPINLLNDLVNGIAIALIVWIICKKLKLNSNLSIILFLSCFTPFLFNGFIIDWSVFPDQSKYIRQSSDLRETIFLNETFIFDETFTENIHKLWVSKFIYSFLPVPFIEGFKSIGFANRFILILLIIFLVRKKFNDDFILVLLFFPSLILYSSVSLRDTLVIIVSILFFYNFFEKNYISTIIFGSLLFLSKFHNLVFFLFIILTYTILFSRNYNSKYTTIFRTSFISIIIILSIIFSDIIFDILNHRRFGMYWEEHGNIIGYTEIDSSNFIYNSTIGLLKFFTAPIGMIGSGYGAVLILDTLIMYLITYYFLSKIYLKNKLLSFFWTFSIISMSLVYALVTFNDGTIHRYKLVFFIPLIFAAIKSSNKKNV